MQVLLLFVLTVWRSLSHWQSFSPIAFPFDTEDCGADSQVASVSGDSGVDNGENQNDVKLKTDEKFEAVPPTSNDVPKENTGIKGVANQLLLEWPPSLELREARSYKNAAPISTLGTSQFRTLGIHTPSPWNTIARCSYQEGGFRSTFPPRKFMRIFKIDLSHLGTINGPRGTSNANPYHVLWLDGFWNCLTRYAFEHKEAKFVLECGEGVSCESITKGGSGGGGVTNWGLETMMHVLPTYELTEADRAELKAAGTDLVRLEVMDVGGLFNRDWDRPIWVPPFRFEKELGLIKPTRGWHELLKRKKEVSLAGGPGDAISKSNSQPYLLLIQRSTTRQIRSISELDQPISTKFPSPIDALTPLKKILETKYSIPEVRIADFEKLSIAEQLEIVYNAKMIVGIAGAGMTNQIWLPPDSVVVELTLRSGWCCAQGINPPELRQKTKPLVEQPQCYGRAADKETGAKEKDGSEESAGGAKTRLLQTPSQESFSNVISKKFAPFDLTLDYYCHPYHHADYYTLAKILGHRYFMYDPDWISPVMGIPRENGSVNDWNSMHVAAVYVDFEEFGRKLGKVWETTENANGSEKGGRKFLNTLFKTLKGVKRSQL